MSTDEILGIDVAIDALLKDSQETTVNSQQPNESEQPTAEQPEPQAEEESVILEKVIIGDAQIFLKNFAERNIVVRPISAEKVEKILKSGNVVGNYITNQNFDTVLRSINPNLPKMERKQWQNGKTIYIAIKSEYYLPSSVIELQFGLVYED